MDEVRRERAVELAFEGHRFNDLRRWLLLDKAPYNIKTSQEFVRAGELIQRIHRTPKFPVSRRRPFLPATSQASTGGCL